MKLDETKRQKIIHPIPPLYDKDSKILILGSLVQGRGIFLWT